MSHTDSPGEAEAKIGKRKRAIKPDPEIEIDVNLPEPPSKKALRKAKKQKLTKDDDTGEDVGVEPDGLEEKPKADDPKPQLRSDYGIWIGNLPWTCDRTGLEAFFTVNSPDIEHGHITRIHMPAPAPNPKEKYNKPVNKGFAYVDFATKASHDAALSLSETPIGGRKVLIKNAKDFNGRPKPAEGEDAEGKQDKKGTGKKLATDKIFVGNLGFEITKEEIREHFEQCGEVVDVFLATFEDSGKCKGYGWVTFASVEAAQAAQRGFIFKHPEADSSDEEDDEGKIRKTKKPRKWFVNKLHGRPLRCEFAEHASERYSKRFGKGRRKDEDTVTNGDEHPDPIEEVSPAHGVGAPPPPRRRDARNVRPGAAHMNAQRSTTGIVESTGRKIVFD